jgi:serpin B
MGKHAQEDEMKRLSFIMTTVLATVAAVAFFAATPQPSPAGAGSPETLVQGNNAYAVQLYRQLGAGEGNIFFSPYSVSSAMGMTYAGARGNTAKEMKEVLHFQLDQAELHPAFRSLNEGLAALSDRTGQKLNIANALVLTGGDVSRDYKALLTNYYDSEIFSGGLNEINDWVRKKTEAKIQKILDQLNADSVCVILNAIYFKGAWESQFDKNRTSEAPFNVSPSLQVSVPLMYRNGGYKLLAGDDFRAVDIPYKGQDLSMVIFLPGSADGLAALEEKLRDQNLLTWLAELDRRQPQKVALYVPKFKLETGYDLAPASRKMGMTDAFEMARADFTGMGWPKGKLYISQIKHKAFVDVNEEGTEAAAATAVEMATKSAIDRAEVFRADHPFFFIIRDNRSGAVLFMGRMIHPGK